MASYQRLLRFCIIVFFCSLSLSSSLSQKVSLSLYYEALCPYCAEFIVNHLPKIFENGLISAIDLKLVPWGNAIIRPDETFLCQHGKAECALNAIHACAINAYPDVMKHFGYIYCTEQLVLENKLDKWGDCYQMVGLSRAAFDCYINGYGNKVIRSKSAPLEFVLQLETGFATICTERKMYNALSRVWFMCLKILAAKGTVHLAKDIVRH